MSFSFFRFYNALIAKNLQNTSKNCIKTPDSLSVNPTGDSPEFEITIFCGKQVIRP